MVEWGTHLHSLAPLWRELALSTGGGMTAMASVEPLTNAALVNRHFASIEELKEAQLARRGPAAAP